MLTLARNIKTKNMETFIYTGMENGIVTNTRSSLFKPVPNYKELISEFENSYDPSALGTADKLFWLVSESSDGIVLVVNDCIMSNNFQDAIDSEAMIEFMRSNGNSETMIEFMTNHQEELYAADIIQYLALPGQTITIQITDLEAGNTEYELKI
jgi:hypothetical protein